MSVICIAIMPYFLRMFTSDEVTISYGLQYSGMVFLFCGIDAAGVAFEKIFQAVGRMKASMFSMMAGCVANIILDPLLIFGIGPFPEMGIRGAALATGLGQVLALGVYLAIYFAQPIPVKLRKDSVKIEKSLLKQLYSIGSAATLNMALPSLQISVLNGILAGFSDSYVFVLGVYYKLQTFLYLSANGIIQGIRPLIGYNYGAGEMKRVQKIYTISMGLIAAIMTVGTILCVLLPQQMIHLFSSDPQVITMGGEALQIISMGFIVSTVSVTTSGALEGLGKGTPSLVISLIRYILFILPVAFLLSKIFGAAGVWHAFWITEIFAAMVSVMVYWKAVHGGKRFSLGKFL